MINRRFCNPAVRPPIQQKQVCGSTTSADGVFASSCDNAGEDKVDRILASNKLPRCHPDLFFELLDEIKIIVKADRLAHFRQ